MIECNGLTYQGCGRAISQLSNEPSNMGYDSHGIEIQPSENKLYVNSDGIEIQPFKDQLLV